MNYRIALVPGDGIGPEVVASAVRCPQGNRHGNSATPSTLLASLWEAPHWTKQASLCPRKPLETALSCDAVLLGAVGGPEVGQDAESSQAREGTPRPSRRSRRLCQSATSPSPLPAKGRLSPQGRGSCGKQPRRQSLLRPSHREGTHGRALFRERGAGARMAFRLSTRNPYSTPEIERLLRVAFEAARAQAKTTLRC